MADETSVRPIREAIFSDPAANVFAVVDGASIGRPLLENLYGQKREFHCLLPGDLEPDMAEVAPYVVHLDRDAEFTDWLLGEGWGKHWGIFATAPGDARQMRGHFRGLVDVYDEEGKPLIFRFYDPRVLRVYLPTCNAGELAEVFGPVTCFILEDEDPRVLLRLKAQEGALRQHRVKLATS